MRTSFIDELCKVAAIQKNVYLIVGDVGYSVVEKFQDQFQERFINAGVAEQSMASIAAGLASEGNHVFVYSIANFPIFRCAEQIRNDVDYHHLPVTIVSVGGGLMYGQSGYSHHAVQDYAFMRSMPNMMIASPGDGDETKQCLKYLIDNPQPSYLRLGKSRGEKVECASINAINPGTWRPIRINTINKANKAILATGGALAIVLGIYSKDSSVDIFSMPLWGMSTRDKQAEWVSKYTQVEIYEDHLIDGGFGSWILESLGQHPQLRARVRIHALDPIVCGLVGTQDQLERLGGLGSEG
jgi:transketolase